MIADTNLWRYSEGSLTWAKELLAGEAEGSTVVGKAATEPVAELV